MIHRVGLVVTLVAATSLLPSAALAQEPNEPPSEPPPSSEPPPPTPTVKSGFRLDPDGFSFRNYGPGQKNLGPAEMRRLFGDEVCGTQPASDDCELTPPATEWMDRTNGSMNGGHCYGFSVASLRFFTKAISPQSFGAPATFGLALGEPTAREIAYSWAYQTLDSVWAKVGDATPSAVLAELQEGLASPATETYTLGIFKPNYVDGHAITPYAIEDRGGGKFAVKVYDNNFPNQDRELIIDKTADTFEYNTAPNPETQTDLYRGDAQTQTIYAMPTTPGQGVQPCPFCGSGATASQAPAARPTVEVGLDSSIRSHAHLFIASGNGAIGFVGESFVNTFGRSARAIPFMEQTGDDIQREPYYQLPGGAEYAIAIDGRNRRGASNEGVRVTGAGFSASVRGLRVSPGEVVTIRVSADGRTLSLKSNQGLRFVTISIGRTEKGADHGFALRRRTNLAGNRELVLTIDPNRDRLRIRGPDGTYDLFARRVDSKGDQVFVRSKINTAALNDEGEEVVTLDYADWDGTRGSDIELKGDPGEEKVLESEVSPTSDPARAEEQVTDEQVPE